MAKFYRRLSFLLTALLLLCDAGPALAQEPTINWGSEIALDSRHIEHLEIVGIGPDSSIYSTYSHGRQITLEKYSQEGNRFWSTAIAPRTPDGQPAIIEKLISLKNKVYVLSSVTNKSAIKFYAQQIDGNGNYVQPVTELVIAPPGATLHTNSTADRLVLALQPALEGKRGTVMSFKPNLESVWIENIPITGDIEAVEQTSNGTAFILTKHLDSGSAEQSFTVYRFEGRNGRSTQQAIGSNENRPLQAKMLVSDSDVVVAGITSPALFVASLKPEPTGTFYYRFTKGNLRKPVINFAPFDSTFLRNYKYYKPDRDQSQRLRNLQLQHLLPLTGGKTILLGEVTTINKQVRHTDDILATAFSPEGQTVYTSSANKLQATPTQQTQLGFYIVSTAQDTVKLIYLDFEYNYNKREEITIASPRAVLKTPVLITLLPDGTQKVKPLQNTQTGRHQDFYLVPDSAYKLSPTSFIVIGAGKDHYKFGRLKL